MKIIQIGCGDGNDHVFELCKKNKQQLERIVLIDADENSLNIAKKRYAEEGINVEADYCAVVPIDGCTGIKFFTPVDSKYALFSSNKKDFIQTYLHGHEIKSYVLPTKSLNQILQDSPELDWLFIDCEGMDALNLLSVDFLQYEIKNIVFEHLHTDGIAHSGNRLLALRFYLSKFGYQFKEDEQLIGSYNTLAYLSEVN